MVGPLRVSISILHFFVTKILYLFNKTSEKMLKLDILLKKISFTKKNVLKRI